MEGPSLVIAREEMWAAIGQKVLKVEGNTKLAVLVLEGQTLCDIGTWGKHFLLFFSRCTLKIHFLLWGSYRVDQAKENGNARLILHFKNKTLYFYSCSIQFLEDSVEKIYDWSADVMSPSWDETKALAKIKSSPQDMVCDILLDQNIFSGVGNIIKNESLFNLRLHPKRKVKTLSESQQKALVKEAHEYTWKFYLWKKAFELKKHWQIMRKKSCPHCGGLVRHVVTGRRKRLSHFCPRCQRL